jgi:hypothetical protein
MSTFKQFLGTDVIVTPFEVNKHFSIPTSDFSDPNIQIERFKGVNDDFLTNQSTSNGQYEVLIYNSIKELYYSNYLSSSLGSPVATASILPGEDEAGDTLFGNVETPNYYNYLGTTLALPRFIPTSSGAEVGVISIPSRLFGDKIQPGSLKITSGSFTWVDDGEGTLVLQGLDPGHNFGNVIYEHGIITLTNSGSWAAGGEGGAIGSGGGYGSQVYGSSTYGSSGPLEIPSTLSLINGGGYTLEFSSSYQINETQYKCTIRENEFNFSLNPTIISGSTDGTIYDFAQQHYFSPYVTTIGLYDNDQNLLAVGKLSQPLPTSRTTDTTIFINIDQ